MTRTELEAVAAGGETPGVEFKLSTGRRSDAAKTVCAMLNGSGGFVLFGVTDRGDIVGQEVSTQTVEKLIQELRRIEPYTLLDPDIAPLDGRLSVIALSVPSGGFRPYTHDSRP